MQSNAIDDGARLAKECRVFVRYLIDAAPTDYITDQYRAAHSRQPRLRRETGTPFDRLMVDVAARHPALARLVDSYCWFAARRSLLRRKLFLLAAILESTAPTHRAFWLEGSRSRARVIADLVLTGARAAAVMGLAVLLLAPVHLAAGLAGSIARNLGRLLPLPGRP